MPACVYRCMWDWGLYIEIKVNERVPITHAGVLWCHCSQIDLSLWARISLLYWQLRRRCIMAPWQVSRHKQMCNIYCIVRVSRLNYVLSTLMHQTHPGVEFWWSSLLHSFKQTWFIKLMLGGHRTLTAAKEECVQCEGENWLKGAHRCSSLIRAGRGQPAQTWDAGGKMWVCVCVCGKETDERETARACFSHSHSRACERSTLSANSTR